MGYLIKEDDGHIIFLKEPMIDLRTYEFKNLNTGELTPEYFFPNFYAGKTNESDQVRTYNKLLRLIFYVKCERKFLKKVMKNQCQNLIETQRNE